jgi:general secretion pathway protein G
MKKGFSLLEMIFAIIVIAIIASVAIPKFLTTRSDAVVSTILQDTKTITSSIQSYYLTKGKLSKISDAVSLNSSNWDITDKKLRFIDHNTTCITIEITTTNNADILKLTLNSTTTNNICTKIKNSGIQSDTFILE